MLCREPLRILRAVCFVAWGLAGPACDRDIIVEDEPAGPENLADENPNDPIPQVVFPQGVKTQSESLNAFVEAVLEVCARGNYDGFRQLFAITAKPPGRDDFKRAWHKVRDIRVVRVYAGGEDPPMWYVLAVVRFREVDRKGRDTRHAVLAVFEEAGAWRLAPAPSEVTARILAAETQPTATAAASSQEAP